MQVPQRAWILQRVQAGATKSAGTAKSTGTAGHVGSLKSVGTAGRAGTPQAAFTATTSNRSALAASPGSTGIKKRVVNLPAQVERKRGGGVSLLACHQYRRGTSAKGDAIWRSLYKESPTARPLTLPLLLLHHPPPHSWLEN